MGRSENAFEYYLRQLPPTRNDKGDICKVEPYVYCSNLLGRDNPRYGEGANSWLSGTASWMFVAASQYIFGIRPDYDGVIIEPRLPKAWDDVELTRTIRGVKLKIKITNTGATNSNEQSLVVNGQIIDGQKIPYSMLGNLDEVTVEVTC